MDLGHITRAISLSRSNFTGSLLSKERDVAIAQEHLTTGRRVNRSSDDPNAFGQARQIEALQRQYEQYERSMNAARAWLDHGQENLDNLADLLTEAYEQGVRAQNAALTSDELEFIATELEAVLSKVVDVFNARVGDEYLYAGSRSTLEPFNYDPLDPTADAAGYVYYGNTEQRMQVVGPSTSFAINTTGDQLWNVDADGDGISDYTATEAIQNLIDALRSGTQTLMQTGTEDIQVTRDHFIHLSAGMAQTVNQLDINGEQLRDHSLTLARHRSQLEDADYLATVQEFQQAQTSFQASLQVTGTLLRTTLLDYI